MAKGPIARLQPLKLYLLMVPQIRCWILVELAVMHLLGVPLLLQIMMLPIAASMILPVEFPMKLEMSLPTQVHLEQMPFHQLSQFVITIEMADVDMVIVAKEL